MCACVFLYKTSKKSGREKLCGDGGGVGVGGEGVTVIRLYTRSKMQLFCLFCCC